MILDGLVRVFSTCRDCGKVMQVTDVGSTTHPNCKPQNTIGELWEAAWLDMAVQPSSPKLDAKMRELQQKIDNHASDDEPTALANAAMTYAEWGWKVFPLKAACRPGCRRCKPGSPCGKKPAIPAAHPKDDPLRGACKGECGKPGHGFHDATNDIERICKWWSAHPDHNIGLATGHLFDVVDVDPGAGGAMSIADLLRNNRIPLVHAIVATAGSDTSFRPSGMHLYVKPSGKGCFADLRPGVDYRGIGGYVVAAPSTLGSSVRSWSWAVTPSPNIKGEKK